MGLTAIKQWLQDIDAYILQRPQRYKFKMNRVVSQGIDFLWDVNLPDVSALSKENDNTKYILVAIDVFLRQAWVEPLKNKLNGSIIDALNAFFKNWTQTQRIENRQR